MLTDRLIERTEERRAAALLATDARVQVKLGQFFTPAVAATLIASMPTLPANGRVRILDPGAGVGSLSAALIARIIHEAPQLTVDLVAVEYDPAVGVLLEETMSDVQLTAAQAGVDVSTSVVPGDFLSDDLDLGEFYDIVIMNPPYAKLAAGSVHRKYMTARGVEAPNLYAAFLAVGTDLLARNGQLVAITPRSFANGTYFAPFRRYLLERLSLNRIHIFESRNTVFADTGVLQENIIMVGTRGGVNSQVTLSASTSHKDEVLSRAVPYTEIVAPGDVDVFIRIPASVEDSAVVEVMNALPASLADLGVKVSTGRVVDFRSRDKLTPAVDDDGFPMVYPANFRGGVIVHPKSEGKPQGFKIVEPNDAKLLVPTGIYVLIKRFSAKEEKRRLVAAVWTPETNYNGPVAIDNKANYVHANGIGVDRDIAIGLSYWLNSTQVDRYFRTFSGHTQVNAGDLRGMRYPDAATLRSLGRGRSPELPPQEEIDVLVAHLLGELAAA